MVSSWSISALLTLVVRLCAAVEEHNVPKVKIPGPMTDYELTYGRDHSNNLHGDRRFEGITSNTQVPSAHEVKLENVSGY